MAAWLTSKAWNYRGSDTFVTDGTNETYDIGDAYPTTRTIGGESVTFGWDGFNDSMRDRDATKDRRCAGTVDTPNDATFFRTWRVDLDAAGDHTIRIAAGDATGGGEPYLRIYDNTTLLATIYAGVTGTNEYLDASGVIRTSDTNWAAGNASITLTFATTIMKIVTGSDGVHGGTSELSHVQVSPASGGGGGDTLLGQACL